MILGDSCAAEGTWTNLSVYIRRGSGGVLYTITYSPAKKNCELAPAPFDATFVKRRLDPRHGVERKVGEG